MNPKNIGSYMEGKEEVQGEEKRHVRLAGGKRKRTPVAGEEDLTEN